MATQEALITLRITIGSREFLGHLAILSRFYAENKDNLGEAFARGYQMHTFQWEVNEARRVVDSIYDTVRGLAELYHWTDEQVAFVMEPGSVQFFMNAIQPLSEAKPAPSTTVPKQRAFWTRYLPK